MIYYGLLENARSVIDRLDQAIIDLVGERAKAVAVAQAAKVELGQPVVDIARERAILERYQALGAEGHGLGLAVLRASR